DSVVGLCVERSLEMVVGVLGILQAGGAYLPLDASYPAERLAYMLADSRASILLTQEKLHDQLSASVPPGTRLIALNGQWPEMSDCGGWKTRNIRLQPEVKPHNLAYVIYTSGSTGLPKGV